MTTPNDERLDVIFGAKIADLLSGMREASSAVKESTEQMTTRLEGMQAAAKAVMAPILLLTAALEGGEMFREAIEKTADFAEHLEVLSQKTGASATDLSRLEYAAELSDVKVESLGVGLQRLARAMEEAQAGTGPGSDALKRLGLSATDATGHLQPMRDVLLAVADRFSHMENGASKTALAMDLFGRSGADLIPLLNQGRDGIAKLEEEADRLGYTMSEEGVRAAQAYDDAMKRFHAEMGGLQRSLALELMPALTDVADAFTQGGPKASAWEGIMKAVSAAVRLTAGSVIMTVGSLRALNAVLSADLTKTGEFSAAWEKAKKIIEETGIAARRAFGTPLPTDPKAPTSPEHKPGGTDVPGPTDKTLLQKMEAEWLAVKEGQTQNFGDLSQMELAFWRSRIGLLEVGSKDYLTVRSRIVALEQQAAKSGFDGQMAALQAQEALDKDRLDLLLADRQAELALIREHYAEESKEVQDGIRRLNEVTAQMQQQGAKQWEDAMNAIPAAFSKASQGIGKEIFTIKDLFRTFFAELTQMAIAAGASQLRHHIATELAKKDITLASVTARVAAEAWGAIQSVALGAWAGLKNIANYAAQAVAAAWASISAIPVVGPFMAPAIAIGAGAAVLGLAGSIKSAEGGYDIPAGVNPMTQLHAQEMVLPAELANTIRGMSKGGGHAGGGTYEVHIHAMDAQSFRQFAARNPDAFGDGVAAAIGKNHSGLARALKTRGG